MPEPTAGLSKPNTNGHDTRIADLERRVAEADAKAAQAMVQMSRRDAEARADRDITERNLPATIRPTLVALAARGDNDLYQSVVDGSKTVPTGAKGTSGGAEVGYEPSETDYEVGLAMGRSREETKALLATFGESA